ncbi:MAG: hypothetical protein ACTHM1_00105 [Solirubrobacteraceae bacterium]
MAELPEGLTSERNRDLSGPLASPLYRRILLCCIAVLPILALLNVFGQHATTSVAHTSAIEVHVRAPSRLRSGLIFQVRVEVRAHRDIKALEAVFDRGWWDGMSINSIVPEPTESSSEEGQVVLHYGKLEADEKFVFWIYAQANPTTVGKRRQDVEIRDNMTPLAHIHRSITIFP